MKNKNKAFNKFNNNSRKKLKIRMIKFLYKNLIKNQQIKLKNKKMIKLRQINLKNNL